MDQSIAMTHMRCRTMGIGCRKQRVRGVLLLVVVFIILLRAFFRLSADATTALEESSTKSVKTPSTTFSIATDHVPVSTPTVTATTTRNRTIDTTSQRPYVPTSLPIKTLVILFGNLRCGELAWESLYRNVLDYNNNNDSSHNHNNQTSRFPHQLDLALAIGDPVVSAYPNASLLSRAKFVFTFPEQGDDWSAALRLIDPDWQERIAPLLANTSILLGGIPYRHWHGSGAISFWIRW